MMDRRHFCKIGALALGACGLGGLSVRANCVADPCAFQDKGLARGCRVTVMRRECYEDMQSLYLKDPETGPCTAFSSGEVLTFGRGDKRPNDFCPRAWAVIELSVEAVTGCVETVDDVQMVACPDGTRPVIFKIEML